MGGLFRIDGAPGTMTVRSQATALDSCCGDASGSGGTMDPEQPLGCSDPSGFAALGGSFKTLLWSRFVEPGEVDSSPSGRLVKQKSRRKAGFFDRCCLVQKAAPGFLPIALRIMASGQNPVNAD